MQQWWGAVTTRRLIQLCQKSRIRSDCTISRQPPPLSHYNLLYITFFSEKWFTLCVLSFWRTLKKKIVVMLCVMNQQKNVTHFYHFMLR
jgi:hypothetical protein